MIQFAARQFLKTERRRSKRRRVASDHELAELESALRSCSQAPSTMEEAAERGRIAIGLLGYGGDIEEAAASAIADLLWSVDRSGGDAEEVASRAAFYRRDDCRAGVLV